MGGVVLIAVLIVIAGAIALPVAIAAHNRARRIEERLHRLEARLGATQAVSTSVASQAPAPAPKPFAEPEKIAIPRLPESRPPAPQTIDRILGFVRERWLLVAGAAVLQIGIAFGVKYSFEHGWISETVRVASGIAVGLALGAASFAPRVARVRPLAEALLAVGLAALYFSGFAAHHFYGLVALEVALAFVVVVAAGMGALAGARDLPLTAHLALVGAYLAPILLGRDADQQLALFTYLAAIAGGALLLAGRRAWPGIPWIAALGSTLLCGLWFERHFEPAELRRSLLLHALVLLPLLAMPLARCLRGGVGAMDGCAVAITAGLASIAAFAHCEPERRWVLAGHLYAAIGLAHFGLARLLRRLFPERRALRRVHDAIALTSIPAAAAGWFDGNPVTVTLAAQSVWLAEIAARHPAPLARIGAVVAAAAAAARVIFGVPVLASDASTGAHALRLATAIATAALLWATIARLRRSEALRRPEDDPLSNATASLAGTGATAGEGVNAIVLVVAAARFLDELRERFDLGGEFLAAAMALVLALAGTTLAAWGMAASIGVRRAIGSLLALSSSGAIVIFVLHPHGDDFFARVPLVNLPFLLAVAAIGASAGARRFLGAGSPEQRGMRMALGGAALVLPLALLCVEWLRIVGRYDWSDQHGMAGTSILIGSYATLLLVVAACRRLDAVRKCALALYAVLVAKMFLLDLAGLETIWRILAFVVVGALLLLAWTLLHSRAHEPPPPG